MDSNCDECGFGEKRFLADTQYKGKFNKHDLIIELAKKNVTMTPLTEVRFRRLDHNTTRISLYVRGDNPDKCHMEQVCDANNENCQWVMVCDNT